jgi:MoaA/NifB/PqqE/SkfB family radical SAM enzyme
MNKIRFGSKLLLSKIRGKKIPFQVNIHLTDRCNLRCKYCYVDLEHPNQDMPLEEVLKILTDARRMGAERISLEGGDPLLYPAIGEVVARIKKLGMECNINTNGLLVPQKIHEIKGADLLTVSIDGDEAAHDRFRGKGSFQKAIKAIRIAKQHGMKVHAMSVMTQGNAHCVDFLLALAKETGAPFVPNTLIFNPNESKRDKNREEEYILQNGEWRALFQSLYDKKKKDEPIVWSLKTLKHVVSWPFSARQNRVHADDLKSRKGWKAPECMAGRYFCVIQTNGNMYPCDSLLDHRDAPNCFQLGFRKAFELLEKYGCSACTSLVCNEMHHLFGLSPSVLSNLVKNYGKTKCKKS